MNKKQKTYQIAYKATVRGEDVILYIDQLAFKNLVNQEKEKEDVKINFTYKGEKLELPIEKSIAKAIIKKAEIITSNIIPKDLSKYLLDYTKKMAEGRNLRKIKCRDDEIEKIWFYLSQKTRNNVFLVGLPDVGKTAVAKEIIRQITTNSCPKEFYNKRVVTINAKAILNIKDDSKFEIVIKKVKYFLKENKDNIVIYIDRAVIMKSDAHLALMLYTIINNYNIPLIMTSNESDYIEYFKSDSNIAKNLNCIYIYEPDDEKLEIMLKDKINYLQRKHGITISEEMVDLAISTTIFSSSVSANPGNAITVLERAFLEAKRKEKDCIDKQSIISCYDSYLELYRKETQEDKKRIAYHETGHYIAHMYLEEVKKDIEISCVSILPMFNLLGATVTSKIEGKLLNENKQYYIEYIACDLAGRVSEQILLNSDNNTGALGDLMNANKIAEKIVIFFGFSNSETLKNRCYVDDNSLLKEYIISDNKKEEFDREVQKIIDEATVIAEKVIADHKELITIIANKLVEEDILTGKQLKRICEEYENKNQKRRKSTKQTQNNK